MKPPKSYTTQTKESGEAARVGGKQLACWVGKLISAEEIKTGQANLYLLEKQVILIKTARAKKSPKYAVPDSLLGKFDIIVFAHLVDGALELRMMTAEHFYGYSNAVRSGNLAHRARSMTASKVRNAGSIWSYDPKRWKKIIEQQ